MIRDDGSNATVFRGRLELEGFHIQRQNHESTNLDLSVQKLIIVKPEHLTLLQTLQELRKTKQLRLSSLQASGIRGVIEKTAKMPSEYDICTDLLSLSVSINDVQS